jgi:hypothetical protein
MLDKPGCGSKVWEALDREIAYGQKSQTHRKGLVSGLVISAHSYFLKPQEHVQSGFDDQV